MPKIMVGTDVGNYVFNPAGAGAGTIQFLQMPSGFSLDQLLVITDVTQNIILYNFADPLAGGTFNNNTQVLTLDKSSSGLLSTDVLQIWAWVADTPKQVTGTSPFTQQNPIVVTNATNCDAQRSQSELLELILKELKLQSYYLKELPVMFNKANYYYQEEATEFIDLNAPPEKF